MSATATIVSTVWLAIFRTQQPMACEQIGAILPDLPRRQWSPALSIAYRLGYFERTGKRCSYAYSVTPRCNVPPGIRVLDVLEAAQ